MFTGAEALNEYPKISQDPAIALPDPVERPDVAPSSRPAARDLKNRGWTVPARPTCGTLSALARLWSAMSSATLMSLAILKVTVDRGKDYLDQLRPFITQVLADHRPDPVTPSFVQGSLRSHFGLEIPQPTIALVLRRMARRPPLQKAHSVIRIVGDVPDPGLLSKHVESRRHIDAVLAGLIEFSRATPKPLATDEAAVTAICAFLNKFSIPCLRAYLRDTAIPRPKGHTNADIVLVADYVQHLRNTSPERFTSFLVMLQGHMLANALTRPDLRTAQAHYRSVTFFFDTPLLVQLLGAEGNAKQEAATDLVKAPQSPPRPYCHVQPLP